MADLVARAKLLIRRPASEVCNAFVRPDILTKFWLKGTTGPLGRGAQVEWQFMVPGATERVKVTAFEEPHHLAFAWLLGGLSVDLKFFEQEESITVVSVEVRGFASEGGTDAVMNATEGFSIVLCDLKTLLESGHSANLVRDKAELIHGSRIALPHPEAAQGPGRLP